MPTHFRGTDEEVLALDTFIKFTRSFAALTSRLARGKTMGGLTPSQFGVLETLYHLGPMNQSDICAKLLLSGANITFVVDNLEKDGLVARRRDDADRRVTIVSLTGQGRDLIGSLFPGHVAAIVDAMNALSSEEQETLGAALPPAWQDTIIRNTSIEETFDGKDRKNCTRDRRDRQARRRGGSSSVR